MPRTVADYVTNAVHGGRLESAARTGTAVGANALIVEVALRLDAGGRVECARFRASSCVALIAYAEAACALAERVDDPVAIDAAHLRAAVTGVHPIHHDRAQLVALALSRALGCAYAETGDLP